LTQNFVILRFPPKNLTQSFHVLHKFTIHPLKRGQIIHVLKFLSPFSMAKNYSPLKWPKKLFPPSEMAMVKIYVSFPHGMDAPGARRLMCLYWLSAHVVSDGTIKIVKM